MGQALVKQEQLFAGRDGSDRPRTQQHHEDPQIGVNARGDLRFRALMGADAWGLLPAAIRQRFSKRCAEKATAIYRGHLTTVRISPLGHALANILRLVGAPLPVSTDDDVPSVVTVTEDVRHGGQVWTRLYANRQGFPQVIHSAKRFSGPTGLEEHLGFGLSMALELEPRADALLFHSAGYVWRLAGLEIRLPRWLEPGQLLVEHRDCADQHGPGAFIFALTLHHPWFDELVHQAGIYRESA